MLFSRCRSVIHTSLWAVMECLWGFVRPSLRHLYWGLASFAESAMALSSSFHHPIDFWTSSYWDFFQLHQYCLYSCCCEAHFRWNEHLFTPFTRHLHQHHPIIELVNVSRLVASTQKFLLRCLSLLFQHLLLLGFSFLRFYSIDWEIDLKKDHLRSFTLSSSILAKSLCFFQAIFLS